MLYIVASLEKVAPEIGQALPDMIQTPQPPPMSVLITTLLNDLVDYQEPLALVLDDYHLIKNRIIHDAMMVLLEHLPSNLHLVIATRADPPFPLARMRGRGELHELRARDLRFNREESENFLRGVMQLDLTDGDIVALTDRTEGWVSGLQMAGLSLARRTTPADFVAAFSGSQKFIADYLTDEVLRGLSPELQRFLLQTSILERLHGSLCEAVVVDIRQPHKMLAAIQADNLFIVSLDDEQRWFRYHRLFADLLQQRLENTYPDDIPALHRRASRWFEAQGLTDDAIQHALAAQEFDRAAAMLEEWLEEQILIRGSEQTVLRKWLAAIPESLITSRSKLSFYRGVVAFLGGQITQADELFSMAETLLLEAGGALQPDEPGEVWRSQLEGRIASMRAYIAWFQGDIPGILLWSQRAMEQLPQEDSLWRSLAIVNLGDAYYLQGDMEMAYRTYEEALSVSRTAGNFYITMSHYVKVGVVKLIRGQLLALVQFCREVIELAEGRGYGHTPRLGSFYLLIGEALCEQNDLDQAWEFVTRGDAMVAKTLELHILGWSYLTLLRVAFAKRDLDRVEECLRKLDILAMEGEVPLWIAGRTAAWKVRILLQEGKHTLASQVLKDREMAPGLPPDFLRGEERLALARLMISDGDLVRALDVLDTHLEAAEAGRRTTRMIQILILKAVAHQANGDSEASETVIERALELAEPEGFLRVFVDEGEPMIRLLRRVVRKSRSREFASPHSGRGRTRGTRGQH